MNKTSARRSTTGGSEVTRFNALRHGLLSRYTVLPWEDELEYRELLDALITEHKPQGAHGRTSGGGACWRLRRKRRLRLAEGAAWRRGLRRVHRRGNH